MARAITGLVAGMHIKGDGYRKADGPAASQDS